MVSWCFEGRGGSGVGRRAYSSSQSGGGGGGGAVLEGGGGGTVVLGGGGGAEVLDGDVAVEKVVGGMMVVGAEVSVAAVRPVKLPLNCKDADEAGPVVPVHVGGGRVELVPEPVDGASQEPTV